MDLFSRILNLSTAMGFLYHLAFLFASAQPAALQVLSRVLDSNGLDACPCTTNYSGDTLVSAFVRFIVSVLVCV